MTQGNGYRMAWLAVGLFAAGWMNAQASVNLNIPSFETTDGFSYGDINGQNGWVSPGNSPSYSIVTNAPAGTPSFLGTRSMLISDNNVGYGVVQGTQTPAASGFAGETDAYPTPTTDQYHTEFWWRTAMDSAPSGNYANFLQMDVGGPLRYGRIYIDNASATQSSTPANQQAAYNTGIDPLNPTANGSLRVDLRYYAHWIEDPSNPGNFVYGFIRQPVAMNLTYGAWYKIVVDMQLVPGTPNSVSGPFVNGGEIDNDILTVSLFDVNDNLVGTAVGGGWQWVFDQGAGDPPNQARSVNDFQWLMSTPGSNTPLTLANGGAIWIDNIPEPTIGALGGLGGLLLWRKRRLK